MEKMLRGKRIILISHCILNQNAVIRGWERAAGAYNGVVKTLLDQELGIIQMPCPEFTWQGEARPSRTKQEYDSDQYRSHCRKLAESTAAQVREYRAHGYHIIGIIGIRESPTCDTETEKGIYAEELLRILEKEGIKLNTLDVPEDYREGSGGTFLERLKEFIIDNSLIGNRA